MTEKSSFSFFVLKNRCFVENLRFNDKKEVANYKKMLYASIQIT